VEHLVALDLEVGGIRSSLGRTTSILALGFCSRAGRGEVARGAEERSPWRGGEGERGGHDSPCCGGGELGAGRRCCGLGSERSRGPTGVHVGRGDSDGWHNDWIERECVCE
jgi:hypothetical protein